MAYITSRSAGPPRVLREQLSDFLDVIANEAERYLIPERGFEPWPMEIAAIARRASARLSETTDSATQVKDPRVSPLKSDDLRGLPPALVITAGCDPLCDEGKAYADRLKDAGVPVEYRCFEHTIHVFLSFAPVIPAGDEGLAFLAERLHAALHSATQAG